MKYYKKEKNIEYRTYNKDHINLCSCKNKPTINTHILSINCWKFCTNFIEKGKDDNGNWIECKYYTSKIRKDKIILLNN